MNHKTTLLLLGLLAAGSPALAADKATLDKIDLSKFPPVADKQGVTYASDIRPLLEASCVRCHGQDRPKGGLQLGSREGVLKGGKDGAVVVPGASKKSLLAIAAAQIDEETAMPPKHGPGRGGPPGPGGFGGAQPGGTGQPPANGAGANPAGPGDGGARPRPAGGPGGGFGPPPKPLTAVQVGLLRAWIDQGAK